MKKIALLLILTGYILSCQKEDYIDCPSQNPAICDTTQFLTKLPIDSCITFPPPVHTLPFYETFSSSLLAIGETNSNELVFVESFYEDQVSSPEQNIWKIDTCINEKSMIFQGSFGKVELSDENWVLFRRGGFWKIKTNGDSLTQLLDKTPHSFFDWCRGGKAIFYKEFNSELSFLVSADGQVLDSFNLDYFAVAGSEDKVALTLVNSSDITSIGYIDLNNQNTFHEVIVLDRSLYAHVNELEWLDDQRLLIRELKGIYVLDIFTGEMELVKQICDNVHYLWLSRIPNNTEYIWATRRDQEYAGGGIIHYNTNISLLNIVTGEEWLFQLE